MKKARSCPVCGKRLRLVLSGIIPTHVGLFPPVTCSASRKMMKESQREIEAEVPPIQETPNGSN